MFVGPSGKCATDSRIAIVNLQRQENVGVFEDQQGGQCGWCKKIKGLVVRNAIRNNGEPDLKIISRHFISNLVDTNLRPEFKSRGIIHLFICLYICLLSIWSYHSMEVIDN